MQSFGAIDVAHDALRVALHDGDGAETYAVELPA